MDSYHYCCIKPDYQVETFESFEDDEHYEESERFYEESEDYDAQEPFTNLFVNPYYIFEMENPSIEDCIIVLRIKDYNLDSIPEKFREMKVIKDLIKSDKLYLKS